MAPHHLLRLRRRLHLRVDRSGLGDARADVKEADFPPVIHLVEEEGRRLALEAEADEECGRRLLPALAENSPPPPLPVRLSRSVLQR